MKILMATMSLDIGGAETHIVELSKELIRRGCEIVIVSNGGVFVSELEECGIRHIKLPLNNKKISSVAKSYFELMSLLKAEHFDIVHAHARIPAFICGLVCKRLKIRFMTSTHGVFAVTPYWKLITNWGERSLAVSYDIKQYLVKNYKLPSDNITVTINGIDTDNFSPDIDYNEIVNEFQLDSNSCHRIVYVSRIDCESAHVGFQLIEAASMLLPEYEDLEIVMVGGGTAFNDLNLQARTVNRLMGKDVIKIIGSRSGDINKFLTYGHIFVGVSRSALEAMAAEKPTILAGSQGYIGIFSENRLSDALETNFCCRGCGKSTSKLLIKDINTLFSMSDEQRQAQGKYNRSIVIDRYSVAKMADDALKVYNELVPYDYYKYGDIILSGYYGFGNMGDDSLLQQIIDSLRARNKDIKITVLSKNPKQTAKIYGVRSIDRFNIVSVVKAMKKAKLLISGGGSLLQNSTSNRSLFYYVSIIKLAKKYGLKVMLYASGIGPLTGEHNRNMARDVINEVDIVTLREHLSKNELNNLGVLNKRVYVTADPALNIQPSDNEWIKYVMHREGMEIGGHYYAVSLRTRSGITDKLIKQLIDVCSLINRRYNLMPVFIPMQYKQDYEVCKIAAAKVGGKLLSGYSASELAGIMKHMQFIIGTRLHLFIYAAAVGTPAIGISCDPKISAQFDMLDLPYKIDVSEFDSDKLLEMVDEIAISRREISEKLLSKVAELREVSKADAGYVAELLKE